MAWPTTTATPLKASTPLAGTGSVVMLKKLIVALPSGSVPLRLGLSTVAAAELGTVTLVTSSATGGLLVATGPAHSRLCGTTWRGMLLAVLWYSRRK